MMREAEGAAVSADDGMMAANIELERMWTMNDDRLSVKLSLPAIPFEGLAEPLRITVDFEADMVEDMIQRLTELRARMLPPLKRN